MTRIMAALTGRSLARGVTGLVGLLVLIFLFEVVQAPVVDAMGGAQGLDAIMDRVPRALQAFARTRPELMAMSGLAGYLSLGFTHPLFLLLSTSAVVGYAARALAGEMERGTVQIALSRPVSRATFFSSRIVGMVVVMIAATIAGPLGMAAGFAVAQPVGDLPASRFLIVGVGILALLWAAGGLALAGAAAANSAGRVLGIGLAVFIVMYFVDYFASVWAVLKPFQPLSLFNYFDPGTALVLGVVDLRDVAILGVVGAIGIAVGLWRFTTRDLPA